MRVTYDRGVRALYFKFEPTVNGYSVEEVAELVHAQEGKLCAVRVSLRNVANEFPAVPSERIAATCLASGWRLSESKGTPWIALDIRRIAGPAAILEWTVNVDVNETSKMITGIELILDGAAKFVKVPAPFPKRMRLWRDVLTPRRPPR